MRTFLTARLTRGGLGQRLVTVSVKFLESQVMRAF